MAEIAIKIKRATKKTEDNATKDGEIHTYNPAGRKSILLILDNDIRITCKSIIHDTKKGTLELTKFKFMGQGYYTDIDMEGNGKVTISLGTKTILFHDKSKTYDDENEFVQHETNFSIKLEKLKPAPAKKKQASSYTPTFKFTAKTDCKIMDETAKADGADFSGAGASLFRVIHK